MKSKQTKNVSWTEVQAAAPPRADPQSVQLSRQETSVTA